jgi:hypothetical protein
MTIDHVVKGQEHTIKRKVFGIVLGGLLIGSAIATTITGCSSGSTSSGVNPNDYAAVAAMENDLCSLLQQKPKASVVTYNPGNPVIRAKFKTNGVSYSIIISYDSKTLEVNALGITTNDGIEQVSCSDYGRENSDQIGAKPLDGLMDIATNGNERYDRYTFPDQNNNLRKSFQKDFANALEKSINFLKN